MHLDGSLKTVSAFAEPQQFESIRQHIDPAWVAEALAATGTATVRGAGRCCAVRGGARNLVERNLVEICVKHQRARCRGTVSDVVQMVRLVGRVVLRLPAHRGHLCSAGICVALGRCQDTS